MACNNLTPKWTQQEIDKLKSLMGSISFEEMTKQFVGRSKMSLAHKAEKLGLSNHYRAKKYSFSKDFWKTPNLTNCYFGGFAAADAYIDIRSFVLSLSTKDLVVLEKLKEACLFTGNIRSYQRKNYRKETFKHVSTLKVNSFHCWREDLKNNFNIVPRKSLTLQRPNLTNDLLIFAYIIGFIDGDGWIFLKNDNRPVLGVTSGSLPFLIWLKDFLDKYFSIDGENKNVISQGTKKGVKTNCFYFTFTGVKVAKMIDFFRQFPIFKLDRKWNNPAVLARIEEMKIQHPNFFTLSPELQSIKDQFGNYQFPASTPT